MNCGHPSGCAATPALRLCPSTCWFDGLPDEAKAHVAIGRAAPIDMGPSFLMPIQRGHYVYRHLDADGTVLYVGRTTSPIHRTAQHRASRVSWWFDDVASIEWDRYELAPTAYWQEIHQIDRHKPIGNIKGVRPNRVVTRQTRAQASA